jgi:hypothetical protein
VTELRPGHTPRRHDGLSPPDCVRGIASVRGSPPLGFHQQRRASLDGYSLGVDRGPVQTQTTVQALVQAVLLRLLFPRIPACQLVPVRGLGPGYRAGFGPPLCCHHSRVDAMDAPGTLDASRRRQGLQGLEWACVTRVEGPGALLVWPMACADLAALHSDLGICAR